MTLKFLKFKAKTAAFVDKWNISVAMSNFLNDSYTGFPIWLQPFIYRLGTMELKDEVESTE